MILVEQGKARRAVADFQGAIFDASGFKFGRGAVHRFDSRARRVVGRSAGLKCSLEFIETALEVGHYRLWASPVWAGVDILYQDFYLGYITADETLAETIWLLESQLI